MQLLGLVLVALLMPASAWAACSGSSPTWTAASTAQSDLVDCHTAASNGDTINVPAGSSTWTGNLSITKFVKIVAAGVGQTVITNNNASGDLISITESTAGSIRLENFEFLSGTGPSGSNRMIRVSNAASGKPVVIKSNKFTSGGSVLQFATNRGLITSNTFVGSSISLPQCLNEASALRHRWDGGASASWTSAPKYGTADTTGEENVYFENNSITRMMQAIDVDEGGRTVIRHNTFTDSSIYVHGADTSNFGGRYAVIGPTNTFTFNSGATDCGGFAANVDTFIMLRGGTALIHDNTIGNIAGGGWSDKNEVRLVDWKLRRNGGLYPCWNQGWISPYQVGWGHNGTGGTPAGSSGKSFDSEPVYLWNNTGAGNYGSPSVENFGGNECGAGAHTVTDYIQSGREYFTATSKPGYTAYQYPHPLTGAEAPAPSPRGGLGLPFRR